MTTNTAVIIGRAQRLNSSHSQISYAVFCLKKTNASRPDTMRTNSAHTRARHDRPVTYSHPLRPARVARPGRGTRPMHPKVAGPSRPTSGGTRVGLGYYRRVVRFFLTTIRPLILLSTRHPKGTVRH